MQQKARTRAALLQSAIALIRAGGRPTIEEAALAVGISRRTAYRYFVSQDHMLADAALEGLRGAIEAMFAALGPSRDPGERLRALAMALAELSETHEAELRTMMRAALDQVPARSTQPAPAARGRRRLDWIEAALEPVRGALPAETYQRLVEALAVCLGVDALLVLRDICGLTVAQAGERMGWMANTLLAAALREAALAPEAPAAAAMDGLPKGR